VSIGEEEFGNGGNPALTDGTGSVNYPLSSSTGLTRPRIPPGSPVRVRLAPSPNHTVSDVPASLAEAGW
jgi:hypothetical protein